MRRGRFFILVLVVVVAQIIKVDHVGENVSGSWGLPPVILIPPVGGSKLEASLSRKDSVSPFCKLEGEDDVWLDVSNFIPGLIDCWEDEMRLTINGDGSFLSGEQLVAEPDGVNVHTTKYGDPRASVAEVGGKTLFDEVIDQLHSLGYSDNHNLFAAPFDWRRGPGHWLDHDWKELFTFVEQTVQKAGGMPVIFVTASFGGAYFSSFLLHAEGVDELWKRTYVASLVTLSSPFAGAAALLGALLWGDPFPSMNGLGGGIDLGDVQSFLPRAIVKRLVNTWPTAFWLLPQEEDEPFVALPPSWGANLTMHRLRDMWRATGRTEALELLDLGTRYQATAHPGVKVYCLFGVDTPSLRLYGYGPVTAAAPQDPPTEAASESFASMFSSAVAELAGESATAASPEAPLGPPPGSFIGDDAWLQSASALLAARMPDMVEAAPGDGLITTRSLSVCERWTVDAPELPAPTIVHVQNMKHGLDLFDRGVLRQFRRVLNEAIKAVPSKAKRPPTNVTEVKQDQRSVTSYGIVRSESSQQSEQANFQGSARPDAGSDNSVTEAKVASRVAAAEAHQRPPEYQIAESVWWSGRILAVACAVFVVSLVMALAAMSRKSSRRSAAPESEQMVPLQDLGDFLADVDMPSERYSAFPSWSLGTQDEAYQSLGA